jgi:arginase
VADEVARAVHIGAKPVVIGGDCTITLGVLSGLVRTFPDLGMVYFDGDVDLNTPAETTSGIFDCMGMAHIIGEGVDELTHLGQRYPLMPQSNIVLFGYNPQAGWIDEAEVRRLESCSMARYLAAQIRGKAKKTALEALERLGERAQPILVHFDVDVIDSAEFPAADVLHEHGLAYRDALDALSVFVSTPRFAGLVITEFNLNRDADGALARRLVDSIAEAIQLGSRHWEEHDPV